MKRNIAKIIAALLLLALLPAMLLLTGAGLPSYYADSYYGELSAMYQRLRTAQGKKLVIVGNSDVAFGLDTALLEELLAEQGFDYTVCPFGLYGAVGTSAMLSLSEHELGEGDLVVLTVGPVQETLTTYFGATAFWKCAEDAPELLLGVSDGQRAALAGSYVSYLQERYAISLDGTAPAAEGVYAKSAFDQACNMVYPRAGNTMALGYDTTEPIDFTAAAVEDAFARQVAEYCTAAGKRGASVCVSFGPMNASAVVDRGEVGAFFTQVNEAFPCPVISDPNNYILDSGWFYDSNFHLNSAGAAVRTVMLAGDILAHLGCYAPVGHELPAMPASVAPSPVEEADGGWFRFSPVGEDGAGWLISGLTEAGKAAETLSVPSAYEGKPVVGFTEDALAEAGALTELRLSETVEGLPDGLFRSCSALERLVIPHRDTLCDVGERTFDGAERVKILIPETDYSMYRDGGGCETNPWADYLEQMVKY